MPVLKDTRKTIEVSLPSFKDSKIILYEGMLFGDLAELENAKTDMERGLLSLKLLIKDWNFTDETGKKLEVSLENLRLLPIPDLTFLFDKIGDFFTKLGKEGKKLSKS